MSKPEDIPQDIWDKALEVFDTYLYNGESAQEIIARALIAAQTEERGRHVAALVDLDVALCQFLNNAADEYDPRVWLPSIKRDFRALAKAYNDCHVLGTMDIHASVRQRGDGE